MFGFMQPDTHEKNLLLEVDGLLVTTDLISAAKPACAYDMPK